MDSLSNLHMCLLQLYLSRLRFSQLAQCSLQSSSSGTLPPPAASHLAMAVLSPTWEQPQSDTPVLPALPNSSKIWPTAIGTELAGPKKSQPSRPDRSSRVTAMPLACSPHLQWLTPALAAVLNLSGSDRHPISSSHLRADHFLQDSRGHLKLFQCVR